MSTNIKVALRARSLSSKDDPVGIKIEGDKVTVFHPLDNTKTAKDFTLNTCYMMDAKQETIYNDIGAPILQSALEGYNCAILAYGASGSGKSYTITGEDKDRGLCHRLVESLFNYIGTNTTSVKQYLVTISYIEIFNETIRDILNPNETLLKLRENTDMGVYVQGVTELILKSVSDFGQYMDEAKKIKEIAASNIKDRELKATYCITINIDSKLNDSIKTSKILFFDLAGSEKDISKDKDASFINKSILALGNVVKGLSDNIPSSSIPYRDSKLTKLLQDILGGNYVTSIIGTVNPAASNYNETISTLAFLNSAKNIKNIKKVSEITSENQISNMKKDIDTAKTQLADIKKDKGEGETGVTEAEKNKMKEIDQKVADYEHAKIRDWGEKIKENSRILKERESKLSNTEYILNIMEGNKDPNKQLIKKIQSLKERKENLKNKFTTLKPKYAELTDQLKKEMAKYKEAAAKDEEAGGNGESPLLKSMIDTIESKQKELVETRNNLNETKNAITEITNRLVELESELEANKINALGEIEARNIEEETKRTEADKNKAIEAAIEAEKIKLAKEIGGIAAKADNFSDRAKQLETLLLHERAKTVGLQAELDSIRSNHYKEIKKMKKGFEDQLKQQQSVSLEMFRKFTLCFDEERKKFDARNEETLELLRRTLKENELLKKQNIILESQLLQASLWEPRR